MRSSRFFSLAITLLIVACSDDRNALLLTISASEKVDVFDLKVRDLNAEGAGIVLNRPGENVASDEVPDRDLSQPGQEMKIAVEFGSSGRYLVHLVGRRVDPDPENAETRITTRFIALREVEVKGIRKINVKLILLKGDEDKDNIPACGAYPECENHRDSLSCEYLDCNDEERAINPFAEERSALCGNGIDEDCSAKCGASAKSGDRGCADLDNDGVVEGIDCDDNDPCRSPDIVERGNLCPLEGKNADFPALPAACLAHLAEQGKKASAPFCGDGVDNDCSGNDVACKVDQDCDRFSPPDDCDDQSAEIRPGADEICGDGLDNNCNDVVDEGCLPCDTDGDGHAESTNEDITCDRPKDDLDDLDAGVFPGAASVNEGKEGGHPLLALRGYCSATLRNKDGVVEREVDHDQDGLKASDDGCPTVACDADGDGFAKAGCGTPKPSLGEIDCDDNNPAAFPGAPDKCGDGIAQDCVSDRGCADDTDGDGYLGKDDCDPSSGDIHPFATEVCDGVDNDCDGLVDEGNPDGDGLLISTVAPTCSDHGRGKCAPDCTPGSPGCSPSGKKLSGRCACSVGKPSRGSKVSEPASRVACHGEDQSARASQRCFGATQPQPERCDSEDWDCNGRPDDPEGRNFRDKGLVCGTDTGACVVGTVSGCDLSKTIPNAALIKSVLGAQGRSFNEHWICTGASNGSPRFPVPEICNGFDDDCDGKMPGNEVDIDDDRYLGCSGCTPNSGGQAQLKAGLLGCNDCKPNHLSIFPGAAEQCNNIDDNCSQGIDDDGATQCKNAGLSCCSNEQQCRDLERDPVNCGFCGRICDTKVSDQCRGGSCVCGSTGAACSDGLNCVNGRCRCIEGGRCAGCCSGDVCVDAPTTNKCGKGGVSCSRCSDGLSCTSDRCTSSGECDYSLVKSGTCLIAGTCYNASQTGNGSASCSVCDPAQNQRDWSLLPAGSQCGSSGAVCDTKGICCTSGCVDGSGSCQAGMEPSACGANGGRCIACNDGLSCTSDRCFLGVCDSDLDDDFCVINGGCVADGTGPANSASCQICDSAKSTTTWTIATGTPCPGGLCDRSGACCASGCLDSGGVCRPGNTSGHCGSNGQTCSECLRDNISCTEDTCASGQCEHPIRPGKCFIEGSCYTDGAENPENECEICRSSENNADWDGKTTGTPCDSGDGSCDAQGRCVPN